MMTSRKSDFTRVNDENSAEFPALGSLQRKGKGEDASSVNLKREKRKRLHNN